MISSSMRSRARDAAPETRREKQRWANTKAAEASYSRRLRGIARQIDQVLRTIIDDTPESIDQAVRLLRDYARTISPWAAVVARKMLADVSRRDSAIWARRAQEMARALAKEVKQAPTGEVMRQLQEEQVVLITSLPREAANRVHEYAMRGLEQGLRASALSEEIFKTGDVTKSRANLIARTEVGRAKLNLTRARAEYVGSEGYIWRSSLDSDVRPSHRAMEGHFVPWDDPPELDNLVGHAGALPNCRCWPEVVVPDIIE